MPNARVTLGSSTGRTAPAELLGHNLELIPDAHAALCSDRLENARFRGPAHFQTGLAPGWHPATANYAGIQFELAAGDGLGGSEAQMVRSASPRGGKGLVQPGRWVRAGEKLEVSLWARCVHDPVTVRVGLRPAATWSEPYAAAEIPLTSACFHEYRAVLEVPRDDDHAVFFLHVDQPGLLALDQVHLRPASSGPLREDVLQALGEFRPPLLRFPGGCLTTAYHWELGVGPAHRRPTLPDPVFKWEVPYDFGTGEFLEFCAQWGTTPVMSVNLGTGTPEEAAEWAAWCAEWYRERDLPLPTMYWQLGNEQFGWWERSHMSGEMYAATIRELAPGIRAAYPGARIVALGPAESDRFEGGRRPWRAPLLEGAGELVDSLALQLYAVLPCREDPLQQQVEVLQAAEWNAGHLREAAADLRQRGLPGRVSLSEWNLWLHASHFAPEGFVEPMDLQHCLYASAMVHHFARLAPEMEWAAMYQLLASMGTFLVEGPQVRATLMADLFLLYRPAFPGEVVELEVTGPELAPGLPALEALALRREGDLWLFLANRSLDQVLTVALSGLPGAAEGVTMSAEDPQSLAANSAPARVAGASVELPPLSLTRLRAPARS